MGYKFSWMSGQMREQSPLTILDFMKQRRRWIQGLWQVALWPEFSISARLVLLIMMIIWTWLPFAVLMIFTLHLLPNRVSFTPTSSLAYLLSTFNVGTLQATYIWGALHNFSLKTGTIRFIFLLLATIIFMPIWGIMEGISVAYALLTKQGYSFHIVKKEARVENDNTSTSDSSNSNSKVSTPKREFKQAICVS
eukprot:Platyproteum_vivax@DN14929_c0_g1_i1.p1